jgi:hypothetical protein
MDGSAFRHLPVGKIMVFAAIGFVATILCSVAAIGWLLYFTIEHLKIV